MKASLMNSAMVKTVLIHLELNKMAGVSREPAMMASASIKKETAAAGDHRICATKSHAQLTLIVIRVAATTTEPIKFALNRSCARILVHNKILLMAMDKTAW